MTTPQSNANNATPIYSVIRSFGVAHVQAATGTAAAVTLTASCTCARLIPIGGDCYIIVSNAGQTATTPVHYILNGVATDISFPTGSTINVVQVSTGSTLNISEYI